MENKFRNSYTKEEIEFLKENVKGIPVKELTVLFNNQFNCNRTESSISNVKSKYNLKNGLVGGQFQKGQVPLNKGKKWDEYMSKEGQLRSKQTCFKKGNTPTNYRPVGSERKSIFGYIEIKVKEPNKWQPKNRYLYEQVYGPIPKGSKVIFADGNKDNLELDNLVLVNSSEELIMNRNKLFYDDKEITKTGVLIAKVINKSNKKNRKVI